uniref:Uncharacterized protein n=1 Tax=Cannabis sativa TaxID=3483 RepID=A0A803QTV4_CANSA
MTPTQQTPSEKRMERMASKMQRQGGIAPTHSIGLSQPHMSKDGFGSSSQPTTTQYQQSMSLPSQQIPFPFMFGRSHKIHRRNNLILVCWIIIISSARCCLVCLSDNTNVADATNANDDANAADDADATYTTEAVNASDVETQGIMMWMRSL